MYRSDIDSIAEYSKSHAETLGSLVPGFEIYLHIIARIKRRAFYWQRLNKLCAIFGEDSLRTYFARASLLNVIHCKIHLREYYE